MKKNELYDKQKCLFNINAIFKNPQEIFKDVIKQVNK